MSSKLLQKYPSPMAVEGPPLPLGAKNRSKAKRCGQNDEKYKHIVQKEKSICL
jgi:hypothetical protein